MPIKILLVDDEPHMEVVIRQIFRQRIKNEELAFLFATDGKQALSLLAENDDVAIVFTDINMPKMNGLTLLKTINEQHPLVKAVVITAYGDMRNIRSAMNHGAFDFLNKPINFNDLKTTLDKTLAHVRLLHELHRERQQRYLAEKLHALSASLTNIREPEKISERFLHTMLDIVTTSGGLICVTTSNGMENVASVNTDFLHPEGSHGVYLDGLFARMLREEKPFGAEVTSPTDAEAVTALICLPLLFKQGMPGMVVLDRGGPTPFAPHEIDLIVPFTNQVAFAIENLRLSAQVRRLAETNGLTSH